MSSTNALRPVQRKALVGHLQQAYRVSVRRSCSVLKQSRTAWMYQAKRPLFDAPLKQRIQEIAQARVRYGARRIYILLRREGWKVNHKRVHRFYVVAA